MLNAFSYMSMGYQIRVYDTGIFDLNKALLLKKVYFVSESKMKPTSQLIIYGQTLTFFSSFKIQFLVSSFKFRFFHVLLEL